MDDQDKTLLTSYEFMGQCMKDLERVADHRFVIYDEKLRNKKGLSDEVSRGAVKFAVQWIHSSEIADLDETAKKGNESEVEEEPEEEERDAKTDAEIKKDQELLAASRAALKKELNEIEIKSGDYQVQVHIIECRELKGKDLEGTSDPVVTIEAFGEKQSTAVMDKCANPVYDELFIFNKRNIDKLEFEEELIKISVMDADTFTRDDVIGTYVVDSTYVYFRKNHEIHRTWVGLINDEDVEDIAIQGYLKLSIQIIGPGDKLVVHDEMEDKKKENQAQKEAGGGISGMVMMPPSIKREIMWLKFTVWRMEYLPIMDDGLMESSSGIDAFYEVQFGSAKPIRTRAQTVKGVDRAQLSPVFNYQLWIPVTVPTSTQTIKGECKDWEALGSADLVATNYFKWGEIDNLPGKKRGPFWQPLYGAAINIPHTIKLAIDTENMTKDINWFKYYNKFPDLASTYRGRVLMTQEIIEKSKAPNRKEVSEVRPFRRKISGKNVAIPPFREDLVLGFLVISGTMLPQRASVSVSNLLNQKNQKMQVKVSCGRYELQTKRVENEQGISNWNQMESNADEHMTYPTDIDQVPDIFIHLCRGETEKDVGNPLLRLSFLRFTAAELMKKGFTQERPEWLTLREDRSLNCLADDEYPGNILIMIGLGSMKEWTEHQNRWSRILLESNTKIPYQLRAHIYQARELPDTDMFDGGIDPYFTVRFAGKTAKSGVIKANNDPLLYETLIIDNVNVTNVVDCLYQACVQVWDEDLVGEDYVGCFFHSFTANEIIDFTTGEDLDNVPKPKWYDIMKEYKGDQVGQVLASFQLIKVKPGAEKTLPPPPCIRPDYRDAAIEIVCLGIRDMVPYKFLPMQFPSLEFTLDGAELRTTTKKDGSEEKSLRPITNKMETKQSKTPRADNANFLERIVMDVQMPQDTLFAPPLKIKAKDSRLGGFNKPIVGQCSIQLEVKCPWSPDYKPPDMENFDAQEAPTMTEEEQLAIEAELKKAAGVNLNGPDGGDDLPPTKTVAELKAEQQKRVRESMTAFSNIDLTRESIDQQNAPVLTDFTDFEPVIKDNMGDEDTGAGVFGALHQESFIKQMKKRRTRQTKGKSGKKTVVDDESDDEDTTLKYLAKREKLSGELELELSGTPFEKYPLHLGSKTGNALMEADFREVGYMKGLIRVMESVKDPCLFDIKTLEKAQDVKVRLYILRALSLAAKDMGFMGRPGRSDPYLKIKLGKETYDGRDEHFDDCVNVDFYKNLNFNTSIPGSGALKIEVWDYDDFGTDDIIGETLIDLEDRWFDKRWHNLGVKARNSDPKAGIEWDAKPLELRSLYTKDALKQAQGTVECWIDILRPSEATAYPVVDIALPPSVMCEVRLIIYKAKDVVAMDTLENMNDLYVKAWIEGSDAQCTDVHWRAKKGKGSWNYRMKFNAELGHHNKFMKFPYLHLQMWDQDILKWNDIIAESVLDMSDFVNRAHKHPTQMVEVFKDPTIVDDDESISDDDEMDISDEDEDIAVSSPLQENNAVAPNSSGTNEKVSSSSPKTDEPISGQPEPDDADAEKSLLSKPSPTKKKGICEKCCCCCLGCKGVLNWCPISTLCQCFPICWDMKAEGAAEQDEDEEAAMEMVNTFKEFAGLGDSKPKDSEWLNMDKFNHETGIRDAMGKVCIRLQIVPLIIAEVTPAGFGQTDPNSNPFLPPPQGRMKFSLNPFVMGSELCGPKLCAYFACCLLCIVIVLLLIFCNPLLNLVLAIIMKTVNS